MFHVERGRPAPSAASSRFHVQRRAVSGGVAPHHPRPRISSPGEAIASAPRSAGRATAAGGSRVGQGRGRPARRVVRRRLADHQPPAAPRRRWRPRPSRAAGRSCGPPPRPGSPPLVVVGQHLGPPGDDLDAISPPQPAGPRRSQSVRLTLASSKVTTASGPERRDHEPGTPPPEPRSSTRSPRRSVDEPRACSASAPRPCPPPTKPRARASSSARGPPTTPAACPVRKARPSRATSCDRSSPAPVGPAGASITLWRTAVVSRPRPPGR